MNASAQRAPSPRRALRDAGAGVIWAHARTRHERGAAGALASVSFHRVPTPGRRDLRAHVATRWALIAPGLDE